MPCLWARGAMGTALPGFDCFRHHGDGKPLAAHRISTSRAYCWSICSRGKTPIQPASLDFNALSASGRALPFEVFRVYAVSCEFATSPTSSHAGSACAVALFWHSARNDVRSITGAYAPAPSSAGYPNPPNKIFVTPVENCTIRFGSRAIAGESFGGWGWDAEAWRNASERKHTYGSRSRSQGGYMRFWPCALCLCSPLETAQRPLRRLSRAIPRLRSVRMSAPSRHHIGVPKPRIGFRRTARSVLAAVAHERDVTDRRDLVMAGPSSGMEIRGGTRGTRYLY
jgi:hypothetical protein